MVGIGSSFGLMGVGPKNPIRAEWCYELPSFSFLAKTIPSLSFVQYVLDVNFTQLTLVKSIDQVLKAINRCLMLESMLPSTLCWPC